MSNPNREWILVDDKMSLEFKAGVAEFMVLARTQVNSQGKVKCPCKQCNNARYQLVELVEIHLSLKGFTRNYTRWVHHGEERVPLVIGQSSVDRDGSRGGGMHDALYDITDHDDLEDFEEPSMSEERGHDQMQDLLADLESELYPGCKEFSSLSFLVSLMHIKVMNKWTTKSFTELLKILRRSHPAENRIPKTYYEAKAKLKHFRMGYEMIDVCKNDCALFWKEHKKADICPICRESRWKVKGVNKKILQNILRYFALKDRLRRLYACRHTAVEMQWHDRERVKEVGVLRHPADASAWKELDMKYPDFAAEPRNVRLGLAADGFNPFGEMSLSYSMWPVVLTAYNLPPWLCMKPSYLMLSLLIPGRSAPGKDMDVFLQPLVEELKELWEEGGVMQGGASASMIKMRAAVLWTINDYPARSSLSGWSGQGYLGCSTCNKGTPALKCRSKIVYYDHRRFLPAGHPMRKSIHYVKRNEKTLPPHKLSASDLLEQLRHVPQATPGKHVNFGGKKRKRGPLELNWSKKSIFYRLPYWSQLRLQHNLDVMHIEEKCVR